MLGKSYYFPPGQVFDSLGGKHKPKPSFSKVDRLQRTNHNGPASFISWIAIPSMPPHGWPRTSGSIFLVFSAWMGYHLFCLIDRLTFFVDCRNRCVVCFLHRSGNPQNVPNTPQSHLPAPCGKGGGGMFLFIPSFKPHFLLNLVNLASK